MNLDGVERDEEEGTCLRRFGCRGGGDELLDVIFFGGACYLLDMGQGCHIMNGVSEKLTCEVSVANFV